MHLWEKMFLSFDPSPAMYELQKARSRMKPMYPEHLHLASNFQGLPAHLKKHVVFLNRHYGTKPVFDAPT